MHYDQNSHTTSNTPGVNIRPRGNFGDTAPIEYVTSDELPGSMPQAYILFALVTKLFNYMCRLVDLIISYI